jgi:calnexin
LVSPPEIVSDRKTNLYTLIVKPDQSFEIKINNESKKKGSLLKDFDPAVNPPKEIDDPEDKKPSDWVDVAKIPDPKATKPEDWDEDAPREIVDESATVFCFNVETRRLA